MPLSNHDLVARLGKLTASGMKHAMDFRQDKRPTAKRNEYMMQLVTERLTNILTEHYVTPAMQWGMDNEELAKIAYTAQTGNDYVDGYFLDHPEIDLFGATPDGFVGKPGLLETKCPTTATFIGWLTAGEVPDEHKPQMTAQLLVTGREWCDFCAYDPRMPEGKQVFIRRFTPTQTYRDKVRDAAIQFLAEVEQAFERVLAAEAVE